MTSMARLLVLLLLLIACDVSAVVAQTPDPGLLARAEAGDAEALENVAYAFVEAGDVASARAWAQRAAEAGRPEAMNLYAAILRQGDPPNEVEADLWEGRAIAAGSAAATLNRGLRLILSDSSDAAWARGFEFISRAQGDQVATMIDFASTEYERSPLATDARVRQLTALAAERGAAAAQWRFAMMLREGRGGPIDLAGAYTWARRSGENGELNGMISTAVMLATGEGVAENDVAARSWYYQATERGSAHALRALGGMFITGEGGAVDEAHGLAYLMLAASGGDEVAIRFLEASRSRFSDEVQRMAVQIRDAWLATHSAPR